MPTNDVKAAQEAEAAARAASGSGVDPHKRADALDVPGDVTLQDQPAQRAQETEPAAPKTAPKSSFDTKRDEINARFRASRGQEPDTQ